MRLKPIKGSMKANVKRPESLPCNPTSKETILVTDQTSYFQAIAPGTCHYVLHRLYCQRNRAVLILSLHALRFQIPKIPLGQLHHHCSSANSQPSSTSNLSMSMHYPHQHCHYVCLIKIRIIHKPRPVQIKTFSNTTMLSLRY